MCKDSSSSTIVFNFFAAPACTSIWLLQNISYDWTKSHKQTAPEVSVESPGSTYIWFQNALYPFLVAPVGFPSQYLTDNGYLGITAPTVCDTLRGTFFSFSERCIRLCSSGHMQLHVISSRKQKKDILQALTSMLTVLAANLRCSFLFRSQ